MRKHSDHFVVVCPKCEAVVDRCDPDCQLGQDLKVPALLPCKPCVAKLSVFHPARKAWGHGRHPNSRGNNNRQTRKAAPVRPQVALPFQLEER
jgi:hypothetical protein